MKSSSKKQLILSKIANGDKRSYNEIAADLELELWTLRFKTEDHVDRLIQLFRGKK